jgi:hypothetical protein
MKVLNQRKKRNLTFKVSCRVLLVTIFFLLPVSCNRAPKKVLSQPEMIDFLIDLHKLDGVLITKGLTTIDDRENVYYYNALLAKHKITKEQFDSSLVWYTSQPKKFSKIYKQVLLILNTEDSLLREQKRIYDDSVAKADKTIDIWSLKRAFTFSKDSSNNRIDFHISGYEFFTGDVFELKFLHRSSPVDSTFTEYAVLRVNYENNFADSIKVGLYADSLLKRYTLRYKARQNFRVKNITGVIASTDKPEKRIKTVVDSISLTYSYSPPVHDALRLKWQNETDIDSTMRLKPRLPHLPYKNRINISKK